MDWAFTSWERKILKKMYGPTYANRSWRIKMTREIYNKFKSPDIVRVTETGRLECCENGLWKDSKEVTIKQTKKKKKNKDLG
jgi:phage tail tube protein FII